MDELGSGLRERKGCRTRWIGEWSVGEKRGQGLIDRKGD